MAADRIRYELEAVQTWLRILMDMAQEGRLELPTEDDPTFGFRFTERELEAIQPAIAEVRRVYGAELGDGRALVTLITEMTRDYLEDRRARRAGPGARDGCVRELARMSFA